MWFFYPERNFSFATSSNNVAIFKVSHFLSPKLQKNAFEKVWKFQQKFKNTFAQNVAATYKF